MRNYVIVADSAADLPLDLHKKYNIPLLGLKCLFKNKEYVEDGGITLTPKEFYKGIREGEIPATSQVNTETFYKEFENHVKKGTAVIYPCFSSALSGTFNSAILARNIILEDYPDADITVIDTKCASLGCGLLIVKACMLKEKGATKDEIIEYINSTAPYINHYVTLDDLIYLKRGGRLSGTAATLGTILQLKPMVRVNDEGQLINYKKVKGRKKSIQTLFEEIEENAVDLNSQDVIAISHSDCLDDALKLSDMIKSKYNVNVIVNYIGCVIGSHTGTDTIALFFLGKKRFR